MSRIIARSGLLSFVTGAYLATLLLTTMLLALAPEPARARAVNILYLNSYHVGYKWSDDIYQGFVGALEEVDTDIALHVEYLDTKRYPDEKRFALLARTLGEKYRNIPIDLVVSSDDAAFLLLQRYGSELFPSLPVFFCGTNYLADATLVNLPNFRGINEVAEIGATMEAILALLPETRHVFIINDRTITGRRVHEQLEETVSRMSDRLTFTFWEDMSMPELITRINEVKGNSVLFYTFFFQDSTGQTFEYDQAMTLIGRQAGVPIFGAWDFNLGLGLTGGMLTSGYEQGKAMAGLVASWLRKTPLTDIPRLTSSPNRFMFDYQLLQRFAIDPKRLPADSLIINRPPGFIQKHKPVLVTSGFFITGLLAVIVSLTINILQRKKAQKELARSERNYRSIFNNASDGLYQASPEGRFIRVNPALARMLKCTDPSEVTAQYSDINSQLYLHPETRQDALRQLRTHGWSRSEQQLRCLDGSTIDVIETIRAVHDDEKTMRYFEGTVNNITEYKKTQELVAQTEKIISLGGVSAGIAHEIRSPLASIVQGVQVVIGRLFDNTPANLQAAQECGTTLDEVQRYARKRAIDEMLSHIHDSGKRAGIIIEDMLSFSRKTIGDFTLESLDKILDQALALAAKDHQLKTAYRFDKVRIEKEYDSSTPKVWCSASKILQVFFNIVKNGVEAMGEAGISAPTLTLRIMPDGQWVRVEIEDNGPGMSSELQQRVFDPFFSTKGPHQGTGLGLSVSYFIIKENHHGELRVASQPDLGATFIIELPRDQPAITTSAPLMDRSQLRNEQPLSAADRPLL